jgi:formate hydrogenlyase subunit 3/multisubunit Na+/H+ antiporter MnhD subunit
MNTVILVVFALLSLFTFLFSKKHSYWYVFLLEIVLWITTSYLAINVLISGNEYVSELISNFYFEPLTIKIDKLSALFILVINFTALSSYIYAKNYLAPYLSKKTSFSFLLHYFNFFMLNLAMLLVVMIKDAYGFLIAWELMSLSSFILVIFESEKPEIIKAGIKYIVQMHIGYLFIVAGFVFVFKETGSFNFEGINSIVFNADYFLGLSNTELIFLLFFIGFGTKAGFFPFHAWLPHAHPAAPSHVSGLMSGVMIKMGIYGIIRVLFNLPEITLNIGIFMLLISIITGLFGVSFAIVQHDLKKLLAYHSIENIGIIGIGIGVGILGEVYHQPIVAVLGWTGALLHIVNHSLFKSLLFFSAGSIYTKTHTRDINSLGGLIKKMPYTAAAFLIGAIAISGIPPFNGFISEFIIYNGLFSGFKDIGLELPMLMLFGVLGLALIGGLALFCFTKAFGMLFLGTARTPAAENAEEVSSSMLSAKLLPVLLIIGIGLVPFYLYQFITNIIQERFPTIEFQNLSISTSFYSISLVSGILLFGIVFIYIVRKVVLKRNSVRYGPTWGCGYAYANPITNQYTATSFAANFKRIGNPIFLDKSDGIGYDETEIFPKKRPYKTHIEDVIEHKLIMPIANTLIVWMKKLAILQTGKIQDYILYPLIFIILIAFLTFRNVI